jgi:cation-transporting ATPase 13A3/4/5
LDSLAIKGYRILSLGEKLLGRIDEVDVNKVVRGDEQGVDFLGFLLLENKLKEDTKECVERLKKGGMDLKIISGASSACRRPCPAPRS